MGMDVLDYFASKVEPPGIVVALCSTQRRGERKKIANSAG